MDNDQATAFIITELGKHRNRNDILMTLCREMNINWPEAERLLKLVETQHGRSIARRQSPILILLGAGILIVGLGLAGYAIQYFFTLTQMETADKLLRVRTSYYMGGTLLTGLGMILGSLIGFWKTVSAFFEN